MLASLISSIVRIRAAKRNGGSGDSGGGGGGLGRPSPTVGPSTPFGAPTQPAPAVPTAVNVTRTVVEPVASAPEPELEREPITVGANGSPSWIEGSDAPTGYPVKVNVRSGIYHVPGGSSYERTNADRWYRSPMAAEADGFRASKSA